MADPQKAQEPTMEEILASIRRIISDDDETGAAAEEAATPAPESDDQVDAMDTDMAEMMADTAMEEVSFDAIEADAEGAAEISAEEAEIPAEPVAEPDASAESEPDSEPDVEAEDVFELTEVLEEEGTETVDEAKPLVERDDIDFADIDTDVDDFAEVSDPDPRPVLEPESEPEPVAAMAEDPVDPSGLLSKDAQATASAAFGALASTMLSHSGGARTLEGIVEDLLRPLLKAWLDENLPPLVERLVREEIERVARRAG